MSPFLQFLNAPALQGIATETSDFLSGNLVNVPPVELNDPTERLAAQLELDHHLLSNHTGLMGTDVNGALSRLRFIITRCTAKGSLATTKPPQHQSQTKSSVLKQLPRGKAGLSLHHPPQAVSPYEHEVCSCNFVHR